MDNEDNTQDEGNVMVYFTKDVDPELDDTLTLLAQVAILPRIQKALLQALPFRNGKPFFTMAGGFEFKGSIMYWAAQVEFDTQETAIEFSRNDENYKAIVKAETEAMN